jgi:outer membrane protein assembly factor BamE (lipoprotein component of BamABCDE complex)
MSSPRWLLSLAAIAVAVLFSACDEQRAQKLTEDVSTEADVRAQFGEPKTVVIGPDGSKLLDYPRQPEGFANYRIVIGADGKMKSLRQLLNPDNLAKVQAGQQSMQVQELIGMPARKQRYELKNEEVWEWRWRDGQQAKVFFVTFDANGKVTAIESKDDHPESKAGGG